MREVPENIRELMSRLNDGDIPNDVAGSMRGAAEAFRDAGIHSYEKALNTEKGQYLVPFIVCLSFSAELLLKLLVFKKTGEIKKTHKLSELFLSLDSDTKDDIINKLNERFLKNKKSTIIDESSEVNFLIDLEGLIKKISLHDETFIDWRYFYESSGVLYVEFHFIFDLIEVLGPLSLC